MDLSPATLASSLRDHHARTAETPLFNPVFQLSFDLSRALEGRQVSLEDLDTLLSALERDAIASRAKRLAAMLGPMEEAENLRLFTALVEQSATAGWEAFRARWETPLLHAVFTAHPTFLLDAQQTAELVEQVSGVPTTALDEGPITLVAEHAAAMRAITNAGLTRDRLNTAILQVAAAHWPDRWQQVRPLPLRFASWVGYDMDGRTDIGWATSLRFRLLEKAERLTRYVRDAADAGASKDVTTRLADAAAHAVTMAQLFESDLTDPEDLSAVADRMTAQSPGKLLSLAPLIDQLESEAENAQPAVAVALKVVAAAMRADGLGMGWIHFRVNSAQIENAARQWIDADGRLSLTSHAGGQRLRALLSDDQVWRTNFASLAIENTTALRQFLAIAQIIQHIDADTPVRLLVAECEQPQIILAALLFARRFGLDRHVDISPLFETESALEHGGRFLAALLAEPAYRAYVSARGRIAIQTGFSDAGRFVGQIPAALAIERIHGHLARLMEEHGLTDVAALIFNTHGESMGRGAHPSSMADRLRYAMSDWSRARFTRAGIRPELEVSYQGGDGYLLFGNPTLALATLTRVAESECAPLTSEDDPFYDRSGRAIDFYRGIRRLQREYLASRTYARAITAFGLGLLKDTGSRRSRRQSDIHADRSMNLRQIRAIPHNAVLQQLGYPVNVITGFGSAAADDVEAVAELLNRSPRGRQLVRMVHAANALASIKSVAAYGELFNTAFWASRPYRGNEPYIEDACLDLAERLSTDDRTGVFRRFAARLRVDGLKLHRLLAKLDAAPPVADREEIRRSLGILQAVRLTLMQHLFLRAVQVPSFSRRNDVSRDDMLDMVFTLRIDEALTLLRAAFPVDAPSLADFTIAEPADYPVGDAQAYAHIHDQFVGPIEHANRLQQRVSVAIANYFGAHG